MPGVLICKRVPDERIYMNTIDYNAHYRAGLLEGLQARGLSEKQAEFFVKQAEIHALGAKDPESFRAGYEEEMQKRAAGFAIVPMDEVSNDSGEAPEVPDFDDDDESFWDKLKRWGLLAGVGAGGFALGNYWPEIRSGASDALAAASNYVKGLGNSEAAAAAPQTPPATPPANQP